MKVLGLFHAYDGGGLYRIRMPVDELGRHGHETSCAPSKTIVHPNGADIVISHMAGTTKWREAPEVHRWWRNLARHGARRVYELDDDPFTLDPDNPAHFDYNMRNSQDSMRFCIQSADLVTCSVVPLAERMEKLNPNVVVCKNRIDESLLTLERPRRDRLTIGWAGGPSHFVDMREAVGGLRRVMDSNPGVELHFIGADMRREVHRPARYTKWCKSTEEYYKLIDFDVGIAPLKTGLFTNAKSAIKAMEYGALGIPVVASAVTPYNDYVVDGVTGFLVRNPWEWARRLRDLVNDEAMRREMGAAGKELAAQHTIQTGWKDWEIAYESVL